MQLLNKQVKNKAFFLRKMFVLTNCFKNTLLRGRQPNFLVSVYKSSLEFRSTAYILYKSLFAEMRINDQNIVKRQYVFAKCSLFVKFIGNYFGLIRCT